MSDTPERLAEFFDEIDVLTERTVELDKRSRRKIIVNCTLKFS